MNALNGSNFPLDLYSDDWSKEDLVDDISEAYESQRLAVSLSNKVKLIHKPIINSKLYGVDIQALEHLVTTQFPRLPKNVSFNFSSGKSTVNSRLFTPLIQALFHLFIHHEDGQIVLNQEVTCHVRNDQIIVYANNFNHLNYISEFFDKNKKIDNTKIKFDLMFLKLLFSTYDISFKISKSDIYQISLRIPF